MLSWQQQEGKHHRRKLRSCRFRKRRKTGHTDTAASATLPKHDDNNNDLQLSGCCLPDGIILEILSRLPLESLSRFRKVSKSWNNAICHPSFANMQHRAHSGAGASPSALVFTGVLRTPALNNFHLVDHQVFDNYLTTPASAYNLKFNELNHMYPRQCFFTLPPVNGLVCFFPYLYDGFDRPIYYCVWNPVIQQHVLLPPSPLSKSHAAAGFGYDSTTDNYKFIRIIQSTTPWYPPDPQPEHVAGAEIYTLGSRTWRAIENVPGCAKQLVYKGVFLDGSLHWLSYDVAPSMVVFDLTTEEFHVIQLPAIMKRGSATSLQVFGKHICLCIHLQQEIEIWSSKDHDKPQCWTKECTLPAGLEPLLKLSNGNFFCSGSGSSSQSHNYEPDAINSRPKFSYYEPDAINSRPKFSYYEPHANNIRTLEFENHEMPPHCGPTEVLVGSLFSPKHIENPDN